MTTPKLDPSTINNDVGLYLTKSRRVALNTNFGELATWIKCGTAGDIVWKNEYSGETGIWALEAGEMAAIACTEILAGPVNIDGTPEGTTAGTLLWGTTAQRLTAK